MKKIIATLSVVALMLISFSSAAQNPKYNGKTLGVLGGMGPAASADFMRLMAVKAPATIDQEHPKIILYSNPTTPDRTAYILGKGPDPEPNLIAGLQALSGWGADILCVTCNTAHYYIDNFRSQIDKPIVHICDETVRASKERSPEGAWLTATLGTMKTGIYQKHAAAVGYTFLEPDAKYQPDIHKVTDLVKAGKYDEAGKLLRKVCKKLWKEKRVPIVAACTELPIAYSYTGLPEDMCVSSLDALADGCIRELYK